MKVVWIFSTTHRFTFAYFTEYLLYNERNAGMAIACQIEKYGFYLGRTDKMFIFAHPHNAAANADSLP